MAKTKEGSSGVTLLGDEHRDMTNPSGNSVVGWHATSEGLGMCNSRGYALLRVVVHNPRGEALYDQPMIVENPGAIVLVTGEQNRTGLVRQNRMTGPRLSPDAGAEYVAQLDDRRKWTSLLTTLGEWVWEASRGLLPPDAGEGELEAFVLETARLEALGEGGFEIKDPTIAGWINLNSTFFLHAQAVVHARIAGLKEPDPDAEEMIGGMHFFALAELRERNRSGEFVDAPTLAAMALCGMSL